MNKLGQEINPVGFLMGVVGALIAFILSKQMGSGIFLRIITTAITGIVCYFLSSSIANR